MNTHHAPTRKPLCGGHTASAGSTSEAGASTIPAPAGTRRGFTLIELLIAIAVVAVLIGVLLPALAAARDVSTRVVCASNIRQLGLGVVMYADENRDQMPATVFVNPDEAYADLYAQTVVIKVDQASNLASFVGLAPKRMNPDPVNTQVTNGGVWDGLGRLYDQGYLRSPSVFYCPSHEGDVNERNFAQSWQQDAGEIVINYQYRGVGPNGSTGLYDVDPRTASIVADGFRSPEEINHDLGSNVLRADLAVLWFNEPTDRFADAINLDAAALGVNDGGDDIWHILDGVKNLQDLQTNATKPGTR